MAAGGHCHPWPGFINIMTRIHAVFARASGTATVYHCQANLILSSALDQMRPFLNIITLTVSNNKLSP